jgi:HK97 family phage major capsid protein
MKEELKDKIMEAKSLEELEEIKQQIPNEPEEEEKEEVVEDKAEEVLEEIKEAEEPQEMSETEERSIMAGVEEKSVNTINLRKVSEGETKMETRNSKEYVEAYAEYCKGNKDAKELRALVTTGGTGESNSKTVAVPDMVYDFVKTAWDRARLMQKVRRISVKGNLKVQFEVSADGAVKHTEGDTAVNEESLVLGIVSLTPVSIKKWISLSDEVLDMRGEEFLRYIYDEIVYRIAKKCEDELVGIIKALPQSLSPNADTGIYDKVSANKITTAPAIDTIAQAIANLSDETSDITIVMNKLTYANFKQIQYTNNYGLDIFEGHDVVFNNTLPAYDSANANAVYAIVGDFNHGALANYPAGDDIEIKYDDKTQMTADLVRILGRRYVGMNAVADKSFTLIAKPASI